MSSVTVNSAAISALRRDGPGCGPLVESFFGYSRLVIWAVPVLVAMMMFQGVWA